jgi:hypothetical protein
MFEHIEPFGLHERISREYLTKSMLKVQYIYNLFIICQIKNLNINALFIEFQVLITLVLFLI